jgi:GDP-4-dehydro-6-deoxy-D-mannose reductase
VRILITGASGFIGRYLSSFAVEKGHEVVGTYLGDAELSARGLPRDAVRWVRLDMKDAPAVARIVEEVRPEAVFHLAAQAYAQKAWKDPVDTFETNVIGTIRLYEALRLYPPRGGVLLAASGAAYGAPDKLPIQEEFPLKATNPYGVSKAAQDMLSLQYALNFGLRIVRARLFGTTGPGKTGDAMNDFAKQVAALERTGKGGTIRVGNLDTLRDVSDIRDVVRAMWLIFERGDPKEAVNVGAGRSISIRWISDQLLRLAKVPVTVARDPALLRPTDELDNRADISRLTALGFEANYPLEQTVADALDFWRTA